MIADIGLIALVLGFLLSVYAAAAAAYGGHTGRSALVESARNAAVGAFGMLTLAALSLVYSLVALDFSRAYVADVSSRAMSTFLRVTALWGGQAGSILFWAWIMAGLMTVVSLRNWERDRELMPWVIAVVMGTTTFYVGLSVFVSNPFAKLWLEEGALALTPAVFRPENAIPYVPEDGQGLNPLLRHFGMILHPPTTYVGFTGFVIPFAFAMAALITGKASQDEWIQTTRRWTLLAWVFLSIGLILGGRWAYDVLGWGGFWGWDPVENAMLMPWLTGTAFVHSAMIQEKRGMLKVWNMILIILTYSLVIFGTFITRTGLVSSVHAFAKSALGPAFFVFIGITFLASMGLLFRRLDILRADHELEGLLSRESVFLLQNVLFLAITFAVFWGTIFPMISELFTGTRVSIGPPYYRKVTGPLFAGLVLLMGMAPAFAWRRQSLKTLIRSLSPPLFLSLAASGVWGYAHRQHPGSFLGLWIVSFVVLAVLFEFWRGVRARRRAFGESALAALSRLLARNRRRYGGYLVHLAVMMIGLAFVGDALFKEETQGPLAAGEELSLANYSLQYEGLRQYPGRDGREVVEATVSLYKDGKFLRRLQPRQDYFVVQRQPVTVPAVYSTVGEDVYVLLVGWEEIGLQSATFKIYLNPLINWAWLGGALLVLGIVLAAWPSPGVGSPSSYAVRASRQVAALGQGD